jgi:hypothetical protein
VHDKLCKCSHTEEDHSCGPCFKCACVTFLLDVRTLGLGQHLDRVCDAIEGALDELNTYKGVTKGTKMPVWASGDDFRGHAELIEMLERVSALRARLQVGEWAGRIAQ